MINHRRRKKQQIKMNGDIYIYYVKIWRKNVVEFDPFSETYSYSREIVNFLCQIKFDTIETFPTLQSCLSFWYF